MKDIKSTTASGRRTFIKGSVLAAGALATGQLPDLAMAHPAGSATIRIALIGCGGIHCVQDAMAMLNAGAVAVQVDSYVWKDPTGFTQLARMLGNSYKKNGAAD